MKYALIALAFAAALTAQVPTPFATLPTDSNDYTCAAAANCATWPLPAQPAPGASWTDPVYGTTTYRLQAPASNTSNTLIPAYSRVQAFNSDNTLMTVVDLPPTGGVFTDLYDATKTPPALINRISVTDTCGIDPADNDALWANTDPHRIYYNCGTSSSHGLDLRYIDVSTCTATNCTLTPVVVHTFSCAADANTGDIPAGTAGNKIETGSGAQGGMFDKTDRWFAFTCDDVDGAGRHEIDFITYDRQNDTVTAQTKWYNACPGQVPTGCAVWNTGLRHNLIRMSMHPEGSPITVAWQAGARDATWVRGEGVEAFDRSYNYIGVITPYGAHQDMGYDVNGVPVWVGVGSFRNDVKDDRAIIITNLTTLSPTAQTYKRILLPCSYNRSGPACDSGVDLLRKSSASHISMVGSATNGYGLFSTMMMAGAYIKLNPDWPIGSTCLACGDTGFGAMENDAIKIDTTAPDNSPAVFYRIGRNMAVRDNLYNAEPHSTVARDWSQILFGSTWNTDVNANSGVNAYWTRLYTPTPPPPPVQTLIQTCTMTVPSPQTVPPTIPTITGCTIQQQ